MPRNSFIWISFLLALMLSIAPLPSFMQQGRPLWVLLVLTFWLIEKPRQVGLVLAWCLGMAQDVLYGSTLGEHALVFAVVMGFLMGLQERMRLFPMWQQSLALAIIYGTALLLQLWLNAVIEHRPPTLALLLPALISSLLWPWVYYGLVRLARRFIN